MSRIGNKVITLPAGVEVTNNDNVVTVKGPKGELTREFNKNIEIKVEGNEVTLHRPNDSKENKTIHIECHISFRFRSIKRFGLDRPADGKIRIIIATGR